MDKPCPLCNAPFLIEKQTKKEGAQLRCLEKSCPYKEILDEEG